MPGGKIVYVPLSAPKDGATKTCSSSEWAVDFEKLETAITPKTKMIVINTPRKCVFFTTYPRRKNSYDWQQC